MKQLTLVIYIILNFNSNIIAQNLKRTYENNKVGYKDDNKKIVIPAKFDEAWDFKDGLARVKLDNKFGYINEDGKAVIPIKYDYAWEFCEGLTRVKKDEKQGFLNDKGETIIPIKYENARDFTGGLAAVWVNGKCGFIDKTEKVIYPFKYDYERRWFSNDGITKVSLNGKTGYIDKTEKEIIPLGKYDEIDDFHEGLAAVKLNGKWGFIDSTDIAIIPIKYESVGDFNNGLSRVELYGQYGFIDRSGKMIINWMNYDYVAETFDEGLAAVGVQKENSLKKEYGYIDIQGNLAIPIKYNEARHFYNGKAEVEQYGRKFKIDYWGNEVDVYYKAAKIGYEPKKGEIDPMEIIKLVRSGSMEDLFVYSQKYGFTYTKGTLEEFNDYKAKGTFEVGPESILSSKKDGMAVSYKFKDLAQRRKFMEKLHADGFVLKEESPVTIVITKEGVDVSMIVGQMAKVTCIISKAN